MINNGSQTTNNIVNQKYKEVLRNLIRLKKHKEAIAIEIHGFGGDVNSTVD